MTDKYLSETELITFIRWCEENKISQKEIAKLAGVHEQWISKVFSSRKIKRNKNFKRNIEDIKKPAFERARARLIFFIKKDEAFKNFPNF